MSGPRQFRVAYGIQPLLDDGIVVACQTVVLPEFAATAPAAPPRVTGIRQDPGSRLQRPTSEVIPGRIRCALDGA